MDYTLALYKSPEFEELTFQQVLETLIELGYPEQIRQFVYDRTFPLRYFPKHFLSLQIPLFLIEVFGMINSMVIYSKLIPTEISSLLFTGSNSSMGMYEPLLITDNPFCWYVDMRFGKYIRINI